MLHIQFCSRLLNIMYVIFLVIFALCREFFVMHFAIHLLGVSSAVLSLTGGELLQYVGGEQLVMVQGLVVDPTRQQQAYHNVSLSTSYSLEKKLRRVIMFFLASFLNSCGCSTAKSKTPPHETIFFTHLPVQSMGPNHPWPLVIENWFLFCFENMSVSVIIIYLNDKWNLHGYITRLFFYKKDIAVWCAVVSLNVWHAPTILLTDLALFWRNRRSILQFQNLTHSTSTNTKLVIMSDSL